MINQSLRYFEDRVYWLVQFHTQQRTVKFTTLLC